MSETVTLLAIHLAIISAAMICVWLISLAMKDASIADVFWGLGFVLLAWLTYFRSQGALPRSLLVAVLVSLWGLRLAAYIGFRKRGQPEDRRYRKWREQYGKNYWWVSLFTVFLLQGFLLWVISLVVQVGLMAAEPQGLRWTDWAGLGLWAAGFVFEATADLQLYRFKSDPVNQGKVMDRGLWATTRHPNYFGECLVWWGLFLITLSTPDSWWTMVSPLTITFLLLKVSGVTLLEKTIVEHRPKYRDYIERTSAFLPWPPKKKDR